MAAPTDEPPIPFKKGDPDELGDIEVKTAQGKSIKLRKIEGDVKINEIIRQKSFVVCDPWMKAFVECGQYRLFSVAWACIKQRNQMKACLERVQSQPEVIEESKAEYLRIRAKFQEYYKRTGNNIMPPELRDSPYW